MDSLDAYIQEIARKHNIVLRKDDPILMLHTFLEKFLEELRQEQLTILENFASTLEVEASKNTHESWERANRITSRALEQAHRLADAQYEARTRLFCESIEKALAPRLAALEAAGRHSWHMALANVVAAALLVITGFLLCLHWL